MLDSAKDGMSLQEEEKPPDENGNLENAERNAYVDETVFTSRRNVPVLELPSSFEEEEFSEGSPDISLPYSVWLSQMTPYKSEADRKISEQIQRLLEENSVKLTDFYDSDSPPSENPYED